MRVIEGVHAGSLTLFSLARTNGSSVQKVSSTSMGCGAVLSFNMALFFALSRLPVVFLGFG